MSATTLAVNLLTLLLICTLAFPVPTLAGGGSEGDGEGSDPSGPADGGGQDGEAGADSDNDGVSDSSENAAAAEAAAQIDAMGIPGLGVSPTTNGTGEVSVSFNGVGVGTFSGTAAVGVASDISAAMGQGMTPGSDINVAGSFNCGCVQGGRTGVQSSDIADTTTGATYGITGVAEAEITAQVGSTAIGNIDSFATGLNVDGWSTPDVSIDPGRFGPSDTDPFGAIGVPGAPAATPDYSGYFGGLDGQTPDDGPASFGQTPDEGVTPASTNEEKAAAFNAAFDARDDPNEMTRGALTANDIQDMTRSFAENSTEVANNTQDVDSTQTGTAESNDTGDESDSTEAGVSEQGEESEESSAIGAIASGVAAAIGFAAEIGRTANETLGNFSDRAQAAIEGITGVNFFGGSTNQQADNAETTADVDAYGIGELGELGVVGEAPTDADNPTGLSQGDVDMGLSAQGGVVGEAPTGGTNVSDGQTGDDGPTAGPDDGSRDNQETGVADLGGRSFGVSGVEQSVDYSDRVADAWSAATDGTPTGSTQPAVDAMDAAVQSAERNGYSVDYSATGQARANGLADNGFVTNDGVTGFVSGLGLGQTSPSVDTGEDGVTDSSVADTSSTQGPDDGTRAGQETNSVDTAESLTAEAMALGDRARDLAAQNNPLGAQLAAEAAIDAFDALSPEIDMGMFSVPADVTQADIDAARAAIDRGYADIESATVPGFGVTDPSTVGSTDDSSDEVSTAELGQTPAVEGFTPNIGRSLSPDLGVEISISLPGEVDTQPAAVAPAPTPTQSAFGPLSRGSLYSDMGYEMSIDFSNNPLSVDLGLAQTSFVSPDDFNPANVPSTPQSFGPAPDTNISFTGYSVDENGNLSVSADMSITGRNGATFTGSISERAAMNELADRLSRGLDVAVTTRTGITSITIDNNQVISVPTTEEAIAVMAQIVGLVQRSKDLRDQQAALQARAQELADRSFVSRALDNLSFNVLGTSQVTDYNDQVVDVNQQLADVNDQLNALGFADPDVHSISVAVNPDAVTEADDTTVETGTEISFTTDQDIAQEFGQEYADSLPDVSLPDHPGDDSETDTDAEPDEAAPMSERSFDAVDALAGDSDDSDEAPDTPAGDEPDPAETDNSETSSVPDPQDSQDDSQDQQTGDEPNNEQPANEPDGGTPDGDPGQRGDFDRGNVVDNSVPFSEPGTVQDDRSLLDRMLDWLFDTSAQSQQQPPQPTPDPSDDTPEQPSGQQPTQPDPNDDTPEEPTGQQPQDGEQGDQQSDGEPADESEPASEEEPTLLDRILSIFFDPSSLQRQQPQAQQPPQSAPDPSDDTPEEPTGQQPPDPSDEDQDEQQPPQPTPDPSDDTPEEPQAQQPPQPETPDEPQEEPPLIDPARFGYQRNPNPSPQAAQPVDLPGSIENATPPTEIGRINFSEKDVDDAAKLATAEADILRDASGVTKDRALQQVLEVVRNRVNSPHPSYPDNVRGVINQSGQFEPVTKAGGNIDNVPIADQRTYQRARTLARAVFNAALPSVAVNSQGLGHVNFGNLDVIAGRAERGQVSDATANLFSGIGNSDGTLTVSDEGGTRSTQTSGIPPGHENDAPVVFARPVPTPRPDGGSNEESGTLVAGDDTAETDNTTTATVPTGSDLDEASSDQSPAPATNGVVPNTDDLPGEKAPGGENHTTPAEGTIDGTPTAKVKTPHYCHGCRNRGFNSHPAVDIYPTNGPGESAVVQAAAAGKVVRARGHNGYGKTVDIEDEFGVVHRYAHINIAEGLEVGDEVEQGQPVGWVSGSGTAFGRYADKNGDGEISSDEAEQAYQELEQSGYAGRTPAHVHYEQRKASDFGYARGKTYNPQKSLPQMQRGTRFAAGEPPGRSNVTDPTATAGTEEAPASDNFDEGRFGPPTDEAADEATAEDLQDRVNEIADRITDRFGENAADEGEDDSTDDSETGSVPASSEEGQPAADTTNRATMFSPLYDAAGRNGYVGKLGRAAEGKGVETSYVPFSFDYPGAVGEVADKESNFPNAQHTLVGPSFGAEGALRAAQRMVDNGVPPGNITVVMIDPGAVSSDVAERGLPPGVKGVVYLPTRGSTFRAQGLDGRIQGLENAEFKTYEGFHASGARDDDVIDDITDAAANATPSEEAVAGSEDQETDTETTASVPDEAGTEETGGDGEAAEDSAQTPADEDAPRTNQPTFNIEGPADVVINPSGTEISGEFDNLTLRGDGTVDFNSESGATITSPEGTVTGINELTLDEDGNITVRGNGRGMQAKFGDNRFGNIAEAKINNDGSATFTGSDEGLEIDREQENPIADFFTPKFVELRQLEIDSDGVPNATAKDGSLRGRISEGLIDNFGRAARGQLGELAKGLKEISEQASGLSKGIASQLPDLSSAFPDFPTADETDDPQTDSNTTSSVENPTEVSQTGTQETVERPGFASTEGRVAPDEAVERASGQGDSNAAEVHEGPSESNYDPETDRAARSAAAADIDVDHEATAAARANGMPSYNVIGTNDVTYNVGLGSAPSDSSTQTSETGTSDDAFTPTTPFGANITERGTQLSIDLGTPSLGINSDPVSSFAPSGTSVDIAANLSARMGAVQDALNQGGLSEADAAALASEIDAIEGILDALDRADEKQAEGDLASANEDRSDALSASQQDPVSVTGGVEQESSSDESDSGIVGKTADAAKDLADKVGKAVRDGVGAIRDGLSNLFGGNAGPGDTPSGGNNGSGDVASSTLRMNQVREVEVHYDITDNSIDYNTNFSDRTLQDSEDDYLLDDFDEDELLTESLVIFDDQVVYSDGTFAPVVYGGFMYSDLNTPTYVYDISFYDSGVPLSDREVERQFGEEPVVSVVKRLFRNTGHYTPADVVSIARVQTEPNAADAGTDYESFFIALENKTTRLVEVPVHASPEYRQVLFAQSGLNGNAGELIESAPEPSPGLLRTITNTAYSAFTSILKLLNLSGEKALEGATINTDDIKLALVTTGLRATCPDLNGTYHASLIEITIAASALPNSDEDIIVRHTQCGSGDKVHYAEVVYQYLNSLGILGSVSRDSIYDILLFDNLDSNNTNE